MKRSVLGMMKVLLPNHNDWFWLSSQPFVQNSRIIYIINKNGTISFYDADDEEYTEKEILERFSADSLIDIYEIMATEFQKEKLEELSEMLSEHGDIDVKTPFVLSESSQKIRKIGFENGKVFVEIVENGRVYKLRDNAIPVEEMNRLVEFIGEEVEKEYVVEVTGTFKIKRVVRAITAKQAEQTASIINALSRNEFSITETKVVG